MTQHRRLEEHADGCLDQIGRNLTDIFVNWTPLRTYAPHVRFFPITDQSAAMILSTYDPSPLTSETDVLSILSAYTTTVTLLTIALLAFAYLFFKLYSTVHGECRHGSVPGACDSGLSPSPAEKEQRTNKKKGEKKPKRPGYLQLLIGMLLSQYSSYADISGSNGKTLSFKVAFIFVNLFFFFQHFFFGSFIKTELVTVDKADIISTYDQIEQIPLQRVKWITYDTVYTRFENAPPGSGKNKLWIRSQPDAMVTPLAERSGVKLFQDLFTNWTSVIGHWVTIHIIHAAMCPAARELQAEYCPLPPTAAISQTVRQRRRNSGCQCLQ